ncbi:MAG: twin-arginine translocation signal domain-containing protein [Gammaproteobacteria bacterium]|nr:hypothetical protein [Gammaproteobacteria bacterium]
MISRRALLKWGAAAAAAPVVVNASRLGPLVEGADALLIDTRYVRELVDRVYASRIHACDGDVTRVWFETLDPAWRKPGFVVAGITGDDVLFVLERLAWDRGRRVVARNDLAPRGADGRSVASWIIAPVHPSVGG